MTELVSMLVPLQGTLPGWPTVPEPTAVQELGLLIGIPALIFIVISLIGKGRELIRAGRGEDQTPADESLWLGAAPADRAAVTTGTEPDPAEGRRAVTSSQPGATVATSGATVSTSRATVGGASVRW